MDDIWQEIYIWIESYSGCTYDIDESIEKLNDPNIVFLNRLSWKLTIEQLIDDLSDIYDIIDEQQFMIPDNLPNAEEMKKLFREKILDTVTTSLNDIKRQLHIPQINIADHRLVLYHVDVMYDLIDMLSTNSMDTITTDNLFDKYNEENDDAFINLFGISKEDLPNMHDTVNSVIDDANASDDEEGFID